MRLIAARVITIGFILGFAHLVTTPVPILCFHDCGEIHLMGATEHLGHDVSHENGLDHDHDHDTEHADGHGCQHTTGENPHDDTSCVDVSMTFDILLPPSNGSVDFIAPVIVILANEAPSSRNGAVDLTFLDDDLAPKMPPLQQLGRLLI